MVNAGGEQATVALPAGVMVPKTLSQPIFADHGSR